MTISSRKRDDGTSSYDYGYEDGFNHAIDRIIHHLGENAEYYARISKELQNKHCAYKDYHYKALALMDFKLLTEQLFKNFVQENLNDHM